MPLTIHSPGRDWLYRQPAGGRADLGIGMGYAPHESGLWSPVARRVSLMDEGIEVLQRCFTGERFSYSGKRYQFEDVKITPGYVQEGGHHFDRRHVRGWRCGPLATTRTFCPKG